MTSPEQFKEVIKSGASAGTRHLVVHAKTDQDTPSLVGFVVPKREFAHAVDRNRIKRRVRACLREQLKRLPQGTWLVIRVKRSAATLDATGLDAHVARLLDRAVQRAQQRQAKRGASAGAKQLGDQPRQFATGTAVTEQAGSPSA